MGNMLSHNFSLLVNSPKFFQKTAYFTLLVFGIFHGSRIGVALLTAALMGRFGKPNLVRETSKIYTNNYLMVPMIWGKKFAKHYIMRTR